MTQRVTAETRAEWRTYCESKVAIKKDGIPSVGVMVINCREFLDFLTDLADADKRIASAALVCDEFARRIATLEAQLADARASALEEAAGVCKDLSDRFYSLSRECYGDEARYRNKSDAADDCEEAIRALKPKDAD